jgi:hypothetical protein
MLGTALWSAILGAVGIVLLMCALVVFMFGPLYYAEYRVGKDMHKRYRAAGPAQRRRMRDGAWIGAMAAVTAIVGGIVAAAAGGAVAVAVLIALPVVVVVLAVGRVATESRRRPHRTHDDPA